MLRTFLLLPLLLLGACAAPGASDPEAQPQDESSTELWWVWIRTGEQAGEVQGAVLQEAMVGHFANMERLADAGRLYAAGPLFEPRAEPDHRGIFLLAAGSREAAEEIANTDPAARAGVFSLEAQSFRTEDQLERLGPLHEAMLKASGVANPPPGFLCQAYVLISGAPAEIARQEVEASDLAVCFAGTLGDGDQRRQVYCLDLREVSALPEELPGGDAVDWRIMPWYSTEQVARLRKLPVMPELAPLPDE